jgi:2-methylisocitrate lyase-like PEP mutase family enzyme
MTSKSTTSENMTGNSLKRAITERRAVLAPFVFDGLQARLAEAAGFEAVYMTGFGSAASRGMPDVGLLTMTEMVANASMLAQAVAIPVICDADTGYGNALNVARTVQEYQRAGAAALHIEDQVFPKRCGFLDGKEVIPLADMLPKVRAAVDARVGDFVVIARTDALQPEGWDSVERRARAFIEAGADLVFVDGIRSRKDLDEYCRRLGDLPLLYNGGLEPFEDLARRGFRLVIHPGPMLRLFEHVRDSMRELKREGRLDAARPTFGELLDVLGAPDALAFGKRYEQ